MALLRPVCAVADGRRHRSESVGHVDKCYQKAAEGVLVEIRPSPTPVNRILRPLAGVGFGYLSSVGGLIGAACLDARRHRLVSYLSANSITLTHRLLQRMSDHVRHRSTVFPKSGLVLLCCQYGNSAQIDLNGVDSDGDVSDTSTSGIKLKHRMLRSMSDHVRRWSKAFYHPTPGLALLYAPIG